ncbi:hypothetical protein CDL15_Pgr010423 [Punica granatum]|nr:hypothetical protein CDL15_Pgr010423 [Punica granatum]
MMTGAGPSSGEDHVEELSGCMTPRREEYRIPERRVPPPPPRKRPLLIPHRGKTREIPMHGYFQPPDDLEAVFALGARA